MIGVSRRFAQPTLRENGSHRRGLSPRRTSVALAETTRYFGDVCMQLHRWQSSNQSKAGNRQLSRARKASCLAHSGLRASLRLSGLVSLLVVGLACAPRLTRLHAPKDAEPWNARFGALYDDGLTVTAVELVGRAPNNVLDQKRFNQRAGHADVIARVRVERVWSRARHDDAPTEHLDVEILEYIMGVVPRSVVRSQTIALSDVPDVPKRLEGEQLILMLRWAPAAQPQYHHHLHAATEENLAFLRVLVADAEARGEISLANANQRRRRSRAGSRAD